ncbi:MAG: regulatory protein RecX [Deltaproteobacteria bacterium]|nr:regulatory protein RecX [Deltaproteobacteria bacterium]MBN2688281.1 regulatory protein RecX [Deltaproteobacteria bacterium]
MGDDGAYEKSIRKAFRLLTIRSRSCHELRSMLKDRGVPPPVIDQVVERLRELSYLDDESFARGWARNLAVNRLWGDRRIRISLREKGIPDEVIEHAIVEARKECDEGAAIERLIEKKYGKKRSSDINSDVLKEKRRIMQNLRGRGFPTGLIFESLGKLKEEDGDDGE